MSIVLTSQGSLKFHHPYPISKEELDHTTGESDTTILEIGKQAMNSYFKPLRVKFIFVTVMIRAITLFSCVVVLFLRVSPLMDPRPGLYHQWVSRP